MKAGDPRIIEAPFTLDQVKSINRYQSSGLMKPLTCDICSGRYYAREEGLICKRCMSQASFVPKFTANWFWDKFKYPPKERKNGVS